VNGSQEDGSRDAQQNVDDLLATFGSGYLASLGGPYYLFLDVEGVPSLSSSYYTGRASTVAGRSAAITAGRVQVLPCRHAAQSDTQTWSSLVAAIRWGVTCKGAWIAHWLASGCQAIPEWESAKINPDVYVPVPILIWQYADACHGVCGFDCSVTNPAIDLQHDLLRHLIPPPSLL
jgi:hypothetical protein